jgi:S-adenosylmethionine/arginine decarboxylase-like enzyme
MNTHQHQLMTGFANNPIKDEMALHKWMTELVYKIDMNILSGPHVKYLDKEGNRGISGIVMIDTSHIAIHIWDELEPALVQMDVYSCKKFDDQIVIDHLCNTMGVDTLASKVLDRSF